MAESPHVVDGRTKLSARGLVSVFVAAGIAAGAGSCGSTRTSPTAVPAPAKVDLSSTRAVSSTGIDRGTVDDLHVLWRFRLGSGSGNAAPAGPVVSRGVVYVAGVTSGVAALNLHNGAVRWRHPSERGEPGENGLAVSGPRVVGTTDVSVFALSAASGRLLWDRPLLTRTERRIESAPLVANGLVYASTVGDRPGRLGALYALDVASGRVRWRVPTVKRPFPYPAEAGGGGARYPPSSDGRNLYWGTTSPLPHGGTALHSNGGSYPGRVPDTDSLLALNARTGNLRWRDQVTSHDVRGYDFQLSPVLAPSGNVPAIFGAGLGGLVVAWNRASHRRLWQTEVGLHRNDHGRLPGEPVTVCPGLLGGVATSLAYDGGSLFVPVVDLCMRGAATRYEPPPGTNVAYSGRGELVALNAATGTPRWTRRFPRADLGCATVARGVVFTSTADGTTYGLDARNGRTLWRANARAGIGACPTLVGNELLVPASVRVRATDVLELTAFSTGR
jgi:outer membrane protein assembly factor BamB